MNLNKKKRGEKKPNLEPARTVMDAERLLSNVLLTRSLIVGKISQFFDPCGFFEPVKLQMKLLTGSLKGKEWEKVLPEEDQIIVCLLSGATNIMALEGIETQDVCAAIERHSNRYGVPGFIFVDNRTQFKALQYAKFSIRDMETQVQDHLGIKMFVSNAKAHSERGRVERRIHALRESLEKLGGNTTVPMTCMQWDTLFSRISKTLDNLPIARGDTSNESALGYDIITPNRLKLGRNNSRSLEGSGIDLEMSSNFTKILDRNCTIYHQWYQTFIDNVHLLNLCLNKWLRSSRLPTVNDIVLFGVQ